MDAQAGGKLHTNGLNLRMAELKVICPFVLKMGHKIALK